MDGKKKIYIVDVILLVVVAIALAVSMAWSFDIELKLGLAFYKYVDAKDVDQKAMPKNASAGEDGELKVHFIDVKQGDCILIELPDGKSMIVDAGSGTQESSAITNSVITYISDTLGDGFKYFDYAILTHPDSDHCNALDNVLKAYPSYVCYRPNMEATGSGFTDPGKADLSSGADTKSTAAYRNAIAAMYQTIEGVDTTVYVTDPAAEEQTIVGGDGDDAYSLTFFSPLSESYKDNNNYSPIMLLEYRGFKFALSGDAEKENEKEFVDKVAAAPTDGVADKYDMFTDEFTVDVFKAGHHGSETSSSQAYLDIMTTADGAANAYYVFSCNAEGNKYYHPRQQVLDRITAMGATNDKIVRTDHHGTITFTVAVGEDGYALSCSTETEYDGDNTVGADQPTTPVDPDPEKPDPDPEKPDPDPENPDPEPTPDDGKKVKVLVYKKLGDIELKWPLVAWVSYAIFVVLVALSAAGVKIYSSKGGKR